MTLSDSLRTFVSRLATVDNTRAIITYTLLFGFFLILWLLLKTDDIGDGVKEPVLVLLGVLAATLKDSVQYYMGSSDGSKQKDKILEQKVK